jgi:photosystem II stability/assembly factor-like uncharacterized protein
MFVLLVAFVQGVAAHTPHDTVRAPVVFSQDFAANGTAYVVMSGSLRRSTDRGSSWHLVDGGRSAGGYLQVVMPIDGSGGEGLVTVGPDGMSRSDDGGRTWRDVTGGLDVGRLHAYGAHGVLGARRPLVAGEDGLFLLETEGTWRQLLDRPVSAFGLGNGDLLQPIAAVTPGEVAISADGGATWAFRPLVLHADERATAARMLGSLVFAGTSDGRVLRVASDGRADEVLELSRSEADGDHADAHGGHVFVASIADFALRNLGSGRTELCALSTVAGLACSLDLGNNWVWRDQGLTRDEQAFRYDDGVHFSAVSGGPVANGERLMFVSGFDGLFRSADAGETWHQVDLIDPNLIMDVEQLTLTDGSRCIVYGTYAGGVYLTTDGGRSWEILNSGLYPKTSVYDVDFRPNATACTDLVSAAYLGPMFWNAETGSWDPWFTQDVYLEIFEGGSERGSLATRVMRKLGLVDFDWPLLTWRIAMQPTGAGSVRSVLATRYGKLFAADDLDGPWRLLSSHGGHIFDVQLSPAIATDRTLFIAVGDRVHRSTDDGASWTELTLALESWPDFRHWGVPEIRISPDFALDGTVYVTSAAGLSVSRDRGDSWTSVALPAACPHGAVHAFETRHDDKVGPTDWITVRGCGMFQRRDGGTWQRLDGAGLGPIGELRYLRASGADDEPGVLLGADERTLYASSDGGATWSRLLTPARIDEVHDTFIFRGDWTEIRSVRASAGSVRASAQTGATAELPFDGRAVRVAARHAPDAAALRLYVDGEPRGELDCAAATDAPCTSDWIDGLSSARHSLVIEVLDTADGDSSAYLDAVDVLPH